MSEVIVSGPTQVMRAGQSSTAVDVADLGSGELRAAHHLAGRTGLGRGRGPVDRLTADECRGHGSVGVGRDDDDRQRATGPGDVDEPPDPGLAERLGEGASVVADRITAATVIGPMLAGGMARRRWRTDVRHCAGP